MLEEIEHQGVALENGSDDRALEHAEDLPARPRRQGHRDRADILARGLAPGELVPLFEELRSRDGVIKPVMSGTAQGAWRLDAERARELAPEIEALLRRPRADDAALRSAASSRKASSR